MITQEILLLLRVNFIETILLESRKSVVARLNKNSWPCSDKALFFPAMDLTKLEQ